MRKKIIGLLMILMALSLAGCGKDDISATTTQTETEEAETYGVFEWPDTEIAKLVPVPKSNVGKIEWSHDYGFVIYVAEMTQDDYDEYVADCSELGFTAELDEGYSEYWDYYYYRANNSEGYHLSLSFGEKGDDVMWIRLDEPDDEVETTEDVAELTESEETSSSEETSQVSDSEIRPEFKEALDSYEAFFDEYIEFMKKYSESDDTTSMLADYTSYMSQYADTMSKLSALEGEDMTTAEAAYYLEVTVRINEKLLEVVQNQ